MINYSSFEYLCIDIANQYGLDKELFETRIEWTLEHINDLELLGELKGKWKEKPLYLAAVKALRTVQKGQPTGHMVGMDAICSGIQIMSAVTGCEAGARHTGLIDTGSRPNAYNACTDIMKTKCHVPDLPYEDVKLALMSAFYGSEAEPAKLFGKNSALLDTFYQAMMEVSPGSYQLLDTLLGSWDPEAYEHTWTMPDNHYVQLNTTYMVEDEVMIQGKSMIFRHEINAPVDYECSNAANVVHSIDAYVLRTLIRRCSYNPVEVRKVLKLLKKPRKGIRMTKKMTLLLERYESTGLVDLAFLNSIKVNTVGFLPETYRKKLKETLDQLLRHDPFSIITVHDDYKAHPNNINWVRYHYKEIMADIADSTILDSILTDLLKQDTFFPKLRSDLSMSIRSSEYALS